MTLAINLLCKNLSTGDKVRVIDLDYQEEVAWLFNCDKHIEDCRFPYPVPMAEFGNMIAEKQLMIVEDDLLRMVDENTLTKKQLEIRNKAYEAIKDISNTSDIFYPILRNRLVRRVSKETKIGKKAIYKYLRKYWRNGMNENALLPNWDLCGAPGEERESGIDQDVRKIIRSGFKEFVVDKKYPIPTAVGHVNKKYKKELNGKRIEEYTFYLHGRNAFPEEYLRRRREGDKHFDANNRLLHGRSNDINNGPCKLYQIDSTPRDIRIVSSLNRSQVIGKPTFYIVTDSWSRAIVGILITLDNPSYITACQALFVAFRSKDLLLRELGLGPEHLGWSNSFLPVELVADRAEFLGPKAENIVKNLRIRIGNTSAYRPDMKGVCERLIDLVQSRVEHLFLGKGQVAKNDGHRTAEDTTKQASVTLEELYQVTWIVSNEYNNTHWIDDYPLTNEMVAAGVKKIPAEIHKWGIENGFGSERIADEKTLWFNLMDSKTVTPSRTGVRLNKQDYVPAGEVGFKLMQQLILARTVKTIRIIYDPRVYKNIYWVHNDAFIKLRLRGADDVQYSNIWEYEVSNEQYNDIKKDAKNIEAETRVKNDEVIIGISEKAHSDVNKTAVNSKAAKSLEAKFNRAKIKNVPEAESFEAFTKSEPEVKVSPLKKKMELVND